MDKIYSVFCKILQVWQQQGTGDSLHVISPFLQANNMQVWIPPGTFFKLRNTSSMKGGCLPLKLLHTQMEQPVTTVLNLVWEKTGSTALICSSNLHTDSADALLLLEVITTHNPRKDTLWTIPT